MPNIDNPMILALATALPDYSESQNLIGEKVAEFLNPSEKVKRSIIDLHQNSGISRRYSVLKDIKLPANEFEFLNECQPTTLERNKIYMQEAPKLAEKAVLNLLEQYNRDKNEITHLISVSCTGVMAPGIEFLLQQSLSLNPTLRRLGINFMGCFGAFNGMAVASALAQQNPQHRVIVVCTELCSLHFQTELEPEIIVGNSLFADGAAAVLIGCEPRENEEPLWELKKFASLAIENSIDKMTWQLADTGLIMGLSRQVPTYIKHNAHRLLSLLNTENHEVSQWAIHPGGRKIIEMIEQSLNLTSEQTQASWHVLENYGNMSSATFLFVLDKLRVDRKGYLLGMGFGPGLSLEGLMLHAA